MREWTEKHIRELIQNELKKLKSGGGSLSGVYYGEYPSQLINTNNAGENVYVDIFAGCLSEFHVLDTYIPGRNEDDTSKAKEKVTICFHLKNRKTLSYRQHFGTENLNGVIGFYPSTVYYKPFPKLFKTEDITYSGPTGNSDGYYGVEELNKRFFVYQNGNYFPVYNEEIFLYKNDNNKMSCGGIIAGGSGYTDENFEFYYPDNYTHWKYYDFSDGVKIYANYFLF